MGEARRRGTYEERKAAAIARDKIRCEQEEQEREEKWQRMSPEERRRKVQAALFMPLFDAFLIPPGLRRRR